MKHRIKSVLQRTLGLDTYLLIFAVFRVFAARVDGRESGLFQFIKLMPDQAVVLDVGANIGVTATIIEQKAHCASVVAFEPVPVNLHTLRGLFKLFGTRARVVPCAVGNLSTPIEIVLPRRDGVFLHGLSHLKGHVQGPEDEGLTFKADMVRLDDSRHLWGGKKVDGIKVDVENSESLVLAGAKELLRTDRPVIYCELWDNDNRRQCLEIARELGYSVNVISCGRLESYDTARHSADNFFLLPEIIPTEDFESRFSSHM